MTKKQLIEFLYRLYRQENFTPKNIADALIREGYVEVEDLCETCAQPKPRPLHWVCVRCGEFYPSGALHTCNSKRPL